jgi:chromosome partitioning protein
LRICAIAEENKQYAVAIAQSSTIAVPRVIALAQQKGGVGKSTLAIHMAVELTQRSRRVAIVDLDPQGTVTKWRTRRTADWPQVVAVDTVRLAAVMEALKDMDFIFLDLPGRRGPDVTAGLRAADMILVPARPLDIDIEASGETIASAQRMKKPYAFAMTAAPFSGKRAQDFIHMIQDRGYPVVPVFVSERFAYPDAINAGLGVSEFEPNGKAAAEISVFTTAVLKGMK